MTDHKPHIELNNGSLTISNIDADDLVAEMIKNDGFLPSNKLWRRWVMAQMLRFYDDTELDPTGKSSFDKHFIQQKPYRYAWDTTLNEIKAIAKMPTNSSDRKTRELFYNANTVVNMLLEYQFKMKKVFKKAAKDKNYMISIRPLGETDMIEVPFISFSRCNICVILTDVRIGDIVIPDHISSRKSHMFMTQTEFLNNLTKLIDRIKTARNYHKIERLLANFIDTYPMSRLGGMPKPQAWKNAFRGAGAYYTMDNMIKFHDCVFYTPDLTTKNESLSLLNKKTQELKPTGRNDYRYYKLYAIMREFIKDNNFSYENVQE